MTYFEERMWEGLARTSYSRGITLFSLAVRGANITLNLMDMAKTVEMTSSRNPAILSSRLSFN